jgi:hypothetical protein
MAGATGIAFPVIGVGFATTLFMEVVAMSDPLRAALLGCNRWERPPRAPMRVQHLRGIEPQPLGWIEGP